MTSSTEVLVCGAGPSGLTAALYLASRGIKVVIVDKNRGRSQTSRAIGVQAGTLELCNAAFGEDLSQALINAGLPCREAHVHDAGRLLATLKLDQIPSRYNFILMLPQSETERRLEEELLRYGVQVQRETEATEITVDAKGVETKTSKGNIHSRFVLGCDGIHSRVREALGATFEGGTYQGEFVLADLQVEADWPPAILQVFMSSIGVAAFLPFPESGRYRVFLVPRVSITKETEITFPELEREAAAFLPKGIRLKDPVWMSRFHIHHRLASTFGHGPLFLVGDAAHVHSPLGAQGMNTGMHEAINLAVKVVEVLRFDQPASLLENYERERRPQAQRIVRLTDLAFRAVLAPDSPLTRAIRANIVPRILDFNFVQRQLAHMISEVDSAHKEIRRLQPRG